MGEQERQFTCQHARDKGHLSITERFCLTECTSAQKGLKAECPSVVVLRRKPSTKGETNFSEFNFSPFSPTRKPSVL